VASGFSRISGSDTELIHATLASHNVAAIDEPSDDQWRIFFGSAGDRDAALAALRDRFPALRVDPLDVADENWAARSQESLRAVQIGRVIVTPPWDAPITIVIRPSMGFGTGHHATTRLMLRALQDVPLRDSTVLDIGCGSGVLAIAAVKLGARSAVGIDNDPDALDNARENAALNDMRERVQFEEGDFRGMAHTADVVVANLTGGLLERSAQALAAALSPGGRLIVSGFMVSETAAVLASLEKPLVLQSTAQEEEWMCAVLSGIAGL
jgi:ribosomal protein L11 methyltransferase